MVLIRKENHINVGEKMKIASIVLSSLSTLMILSELICRLWLHSQGATPDGITFHVRFGIATVILVLITIVMLLIFVLKH
jgi:hypothetical protein